MDHEPELVWYVVKYYARLMTTPERLANRHLIGAMKATHGKGVVGAQAEARKVWSFSRMMSHEPEVLRLAENGYAAFIQRTAARILNEQSDEIFFNRCPKCGRLARTPQARQCRSCGHDWHV